jgi:murein DD-endopeptidase MepM/ murein hydrolase activator NlpD
VWVIGPDLSRHYYAHLDTYAQQIDVGDWVEQGTVLGYVGNTGNAKNTPPHLHYGIYLTGQGAVNPYPYLRSTGN